MGSCALSLLEICETDASWRYTTRQKIEAAFVEMVTAVSPCSLRPRSSRNAVPNCGAQHALADFGLGG